MQAGSEGSRMKTITLRNIPRDLAKVIEKKARASGQSLARTVLDLCKEGAGIRRPAQPALHHDLDALAGTWTEEEAAAFESALREQRKIDPELWE
jgi:hypothetical protein